MLKISLFLLNSLSILILKRLLHSSRNLNLRKSNYYYLLTTSLTQGFFMYIKYTFIFLSIAMIGAFNSTHPMEGLEDDTVALTSNFQKLTLQKCTSPIPIKVW